MSGERFVYPLYGCSCAARAAGSRGGDVSGWPGRTCRLGTLDDGLECLLPSVLDWRFLQPSEATDMNDVWDPEDHLPWPCIVISGQALHCLGAGVVGEARHRAAAGLADDVVRAVRLYKDGWFLDPSLSESIHDNGKGGLQRSMGAYRMLYHDEDTESSRPAKDSCLQLDAADFTAGSVLHRIFRVLREHRRFPVASAEVALEALGRSYGCQLAVSQRLLLLAMTMEVMFSRRHAPSELTTPIQRLQAVLMLGGIKDSADAAQWLATELPALRNAVAHGRRLNERTHEEAARRLAGFTRRALLVYLIFSRHWRLGGPSIDTLAGPSADCRAAFNNWLARVATQGISDEDRLWLMPSDSSDEFRTS